ncbi:hypothetical protein F2Q69_00021390 [Brassica cretica]|uniref:Uncharacterized protein n=1 Tax=Brassica cretica TaxID=69181 RepID=A0A8S9QD13_BRACR|nr:hypothetical protein F2Q69_00021390 [Brassica cretica]
MSRSHGRPSIMLYEDMQSMTRNSVDKLIPSAYTGRITSPKVCLTSPLNPISGVIFRVNAFSSSPRHRGGELGDAPQIIDLGQDDATMVEPDDSSTKDKI